MVNPITYLYFPNNTTNSCILLFLREKLKKACVRTRDGVETTAVWKADISAPRAYSGGKGGNAFTTMG
jgi:hypothetical protein